MIQIHKWRKSRFERDSRFYLLLVEQDLFANWIVTRINGRKESRLGRIVHEAYASYQEAYDRYQELAIHRIKRRKYHQRSISIAFIGET